MSEKPKLEGKPIYDTPVKMLPDMIHCYQCMDYAMGEEEEPDCEKCKSARYRYGYLQKVERKLLSDYGVVIFEDGEIATVPLHRLEILNVPKVER